jgi:hypothetical protein
MTIVKALRSSFDYQGSCPIYWTGETVDGSEVSLCCRNGYIKLTLFSPESSVEVALERETDVQDFSVDHYNIDAVCRATGVELVP